GNLPGNRWDNVLDTKKPIDIVVGHPTFPASDHLPIIATLEPLEDKKGGFIMDKFGKLPIANQKKVGSDYQITPIASELPADNLKIEGSTNPDLKPYLDLIASDKPTLPLVTNI